MRKIAILGFIGSATTSVIIDQLKDKGIEVIVLDAPKPDIPHITEIMIEELTVARMEHASSLFERSNTHLPSPKKVGKYRSPMITKHLHKPATNRGK